MNRRQALRLAGLSLVCLGGCNTAISEVEDPSTGEDETSIRTAEAIVQGPECVTDSVPNPSANNGVDPMDYPELNTSANAEEIGEWAAEFDRVYLYNSYLSIERRDPMVLNFDGHVEDIQQTGDAIRVSVETTGVYEFMDDFRRETDISPGAEPIHGRRIQVQRESIYVIEEQRAVRRPSTGSETVVITC